MSQAGPLVRTVTVRPAAAPSERARLRALLLGLRSRYVVPVLAAEEDEHGLVVRYDAPADITTLAARCAAGPAMSLPEVVRLAADTAWGLAAGTATGLAHGRLDATQIVLGDGPARVLGLGLAMLDAAPPPAGVALAPEVRAGGPPSEAADLWALGTVVRGLVAGLDPPLKLADLLARMVDPQPSRRPASARAVATRLVSLRLAAPHVPAQGGAAPARAASPATAAPAGRASTATHGAPATGGDGATAPPPAAAPETLPSGLRSRLRRPADRTSRPLALGVATAVLIAAGVLVALTTRGSGAPRPPALAPRAPAATPAAPTPSGTPRAHPPAVPLPIVAATTPADPLEVARLRRMSLVPTDVAAHARALAVPASSNFDAVLRALYAECDYFTPVGQQPSAHQFTGFVDGDVEVFDDLTAYAAGVPGQVISGVAVAIAKCPTIRIDSGSPSAAPAEFAVHRVAPPPGVPSDAVAMTYTRTDDPDLDVRAVFLGTGTTLRVVLALAPPSAPAEPDWTRAAARAWARLVDVG